MYIPYMPCHIPFKLYTCWLKKRNHIRPTCLMVCLQCLAQDFWTCRESCGRGWTNSGLLVYAMRQWKTGYSYRLDSCRSNFTQQVFWTHELFFNHMKYACFSSSTCCVGFFGCSRSHGLTHWRSLWKQLLCYPFLEHRQLILQTWYSTPCPPHERNCN